MVRFRSIGLIVAAFVLAILIASTGSTLADGAADHQSFVPVVTDVKANSSTCNRVVNAGESIQAAIKASSSGQTVCVRGGVYVQEVKMNKAGISLIAYPGETPVIDGQGRLPAKGTYTPLIRIMASNTVVSGFEVRDSRARGITVGPAGRKPVSNVIVRGNTIHGSRERGISVIGTKPAILENILLENNVVYENVVWNTTSSKWIGGSGVAFHYTRNSTARGNHVYRNYGEGLVAAKYTTNITLEDNVVYDNSHANIYLTSTTNPTVRRNLVFCTDDRTFWSNWNGAGATPSPGIQIRDEKFSGWSTLPSVGKGQIIINNIVVGCGTNFGVAAQISGRGLVDAVVANNSFINARGDAVGPVNNVKFEGTATYKNSLFANNLIVQTVPGSMVRLMPGQGNPNFSTMQVANNLYSQTPPSGWFDGSGSTNNEPGRVVGDPKLSNLVLPTKNNLANANNYKLLSASPAVNKGKAVNQVVIDYFKQSRSGALDIGADELGN